MFLCRPVASACPAVLFSACRQARHQKRCEGGRGQTALISRLLALFPSALRVESNLISTPWLDNTLRCGPQRGLQRSYSNTHSVKTASLVVIGQCSIARVLPPPCGIPVCFRADWDSSPNAIVWPRVPVP